MMPALRGAHRFWPENKCCQITTQTLSKGRKTPTLNSLTYLFPGPHAVWPLCLNTTEDSWMCVQFWSWDHVTVQKTQSWCSKLRGVIASFGWTCPLSDTQSTCVSWAGSPFGAAAVVCLTLPPAWPSAPFLPGAMSPYFLQVIPPCPAGLSQHTVLVKRPYREDIGS